MSLDPDQNQGKKSLHPDQNPENSTNIEQSPANIPQKAEETEFKTDEQAYLVDPEKNSSNIDQSPVNIPEKAKQTEFKPEEQEQAYLVDPEKLESRVDFSEQDEVSHKRVSVTRDEKADTGDLITYHIVIDGGRLRLDKGSFL